jgi:hypothetical protein
MKASIYSQKIPFDKNFQAREVRENWFFKKITKAIRPGDYSFSAAGFKKSQCRFCLTPDFF